MKEESRIDIIMSPFFLLGLTTLLLNDFYFKYEYSNEITGKLSDIAGLFIFPFFFSTLIPRWSRGIYLMTAGLFIFWSSELSQGFID